MSNSNSAYGDVSDGESSLPDCQTFWSGSSNSNYSPRDITPPLIQACALIFSIFTYLCSFRNWPR